MTGQNFVHCLKFILKLDKASTQTSHAEIETIGKYARNKTRAVEIGVFEGVNTVTIAQSLVQEGRLYAIDPFFRGKLGICYGKWITVINLRRNKVLQKVNLISKYSFDAGDDVGEGIDFIFVDGDHSYEGVKKDWEIYAGKVKKDGYILLHDTSVPAFDPHRASLGSIRFFTEVISKDPRFTVIETVDSLNVLQKTA